MMKKKKNLTDKKWDRICSKIMTNNIRVKVPRAFLPVLTLFFHHISDALYGDDRPDHGLAMMRQGREYSSIPFYFLYGKLRRAEKKMSAAQQSKALRLFSKYHKLSEERERQFRERLKRKY